MDYGRPDQLMPRITPGVIAEETEEGMLLVKEDGEYLVINRTGGILWKMLARGATLEQIVERLMDLPSGPEVSKCRKIVLDFFDGLVNEGYLQKAP